MKPDVYTDAEWVLFTKHLEGLAVKYRDMVSSQITDKKLLCLFYQLMRQIQTNPHAATADKKLADKVTSRYIIYACGDVVCHDCTSSLYEVMNGKPKPR